MDRQTTSTGSTGFARIRSLLAFRHRNRAARAISTVLAFAIAMLLVVGSGPAYADDVAPTDPALETTATNQDAATGEGDEPPPAPEEGEPKTEVPPGEETTTPTDDVVVEEADDLSGALPSDLSGNAPAPKTMLAKSQGPISDALEILALAGDCFGTGGTIFGNFEIDGNTCVDSPVPTPPAIRPTDWDTPFGSKIQDQFEPADTNGFTGGSSKVALDPAGWLIDNDANTKADVKTAWAGSRIVGGHVFTYFAFERHPKDFPGANGDVAYHVEYNQLPNQTTTGGLSVPDRSPGDLMLVVNQSGSSTLSISGDGAGVFEYKAGHPGSAGCFVADTADGAGSWCPKTPGPAFKSAVNPESSFGEAALDITALFGPGTCSGSFGVINMRSSSSTETTSAMQDYIVPINATTPSTCGKIIINKYDENAAHLGGATFTVSPNPVPGASNATPYSITDNDAKDKNPANGVIEISPVDPGDSYTVTETGAPSGYMIDNPLGTSTNPQTVGASETKTFNFTDHRIWKGVTATKDATPRYTATYNWSVDKEISPNGTSGWTSATTPGSPLVKNVPSGTADTLFYRVTATEGARDTSDYVVDGKVYVTNPADNVGAMTVDLSDSVPGDTSCTFPDGATVSVPADGVAHAYDYTCDLGDSPAAADVTGLKTNTATVAWDRSDYPQVPADLTNNGTRSVSPTASYNFASAVVTEVDKTVTVTDDQHTFDPAWTITWDDQDGLTNASGVYSQTLTVAGGTCSAVFDNTASVTGDESVLDTDSAYGKVCEASPLVVSKNKTVSMTRTYLWQIEKTRTSGPRITSGESADYSVTVSRAAGDGFNDTGWAMNGVVTVTNPNDWQSVTMTSLVDRFDGDNDETNSCSVDTSRVAGTSTWGAVDLSLDPSQVMEYQYSCEFDVKPDYDGTNTATATWVAASAHTTPDAGSANSTSQGTAAVSSSDWVLGSTPVNKVITVVDDAYTGGSGDGGHTLGTVDWDDAPDTFTYSMPWTAPAGECDDKPNTATIVETQQSSSATVKVCNPLGITPDIDADGNFTRTYGWSLDKEIVGADSVSIDEYTHVFDYVVRAIPGARVDSAWVVSGTISLHNDNTDSEIPDITGIDVEAVASVGSAASCTYDAWDQTLASGESEDVGFSCTLAPTPTNDSAEPPVYGGTFQGKVTWGTSGEESSPSRAVDWKAPTEVDKTISVYDNQTSAITPAVLLGTAAWNAAGTPVLLGGPTTTYDLTLPLAGSARIDGGTCGQFPNVAWIAGSLGGTAFGPAANVPAWQDTATAEICVNPGTWTVAKVNVDGDGPVPTDSDVTYRLTAHKTGGVNPEDVVLLDDLSDLVPHIDAFVPPAAPAGTTVEYDPETHVLTWTIDELDATDRTLELTVHVKADAYGVDLPNLVTSPGSTNCPDEETAGPGCDTDNDTPHYTLAKSSDAGAEVLPPYLGDPGTLITYTLTVHNDSDAPINGTTMPGEQVTDDLTEVLDNAAWVGNLTPDGQAERVGNTLTWTLPEIPVDGTATLTYQVRVDGDQWDQTLTNEAFTGDGGDCLGAAEAEEGEENANCTTTTVTPPYTQLQALKVDLETGDPLAGAEFSLFHGETEIDTAVSGDDGIAFFDVKLQPGEFVIQETEAPDGYDLPINGLDTVTVTIDEPEAEGSNFVENGVMAAIEFEDPALGQLALLPKEQYERAGLGWVASDGEVEFGDEIRYVVPVASEGKKLFHDVTLTDYVPGWNPADVTTAPVGTKAELVVDSIACGGGVTCTSDVDLTTGLITWQLTETGEETGVFDGDASGFVEFVVRMPDIPGTSPIAAPGTVFAAALWNQAYLDWDQLDLVETEQETARGLTAATVAPEMVHHRLASDEVVVVANATLPPETPEVPEVIPPAGPQALPSTGGPGRWLLVAGLVLLLGGGALVAADRRRRLRG